MSGTRLKSTVVICTRNRAELFERVCREVVCQDTGRDDWELLVVDNNSTDDTMERARRLESEHPARVRVLLEKKVGLSVARNRAIRESRGGHVLFLDDDAFPTPGWVSTLSGALERDDVACVGGRVFPLIQAELPRWFLGRYLPYLTAWDLGDEIVNLTYNEYPRGANMGFRRDVLEAVGGFTDDLGRTGASLLSCEEIELCLRIERMQLGSIRYVPNASVRHVTPANRLTKSWFKNRFAAQGRSEAIIFWCHGGWPALIKGIVLRRRAFTSAIGGVGEAQKLFARFKKSEYRSFIAGAAVAPITTQRWKPPNGTDSEPWRPTF